MDKTVTEWQIMFTMTSGLEDFYTEDEDELVIEGKDKKTGKKIRTINYVLYKSIDEYDISYFYYKKKEKFEKLELNMYKKRLCME